jgi:hypothetical protein
MRRFQRYSSGANGQVEGVQTPCQGSKCAKVGTTSGSQESIRESGGGTRDGAGKRVMESEMCTKNDKEGLGKAVAGKGGGC